MQNRRLIEYIAVLIVLAFALGSIPRGTGGGGTLLFQSTWLLYLIYLGPVVALVMLVALVALLAFNWRDLAAGIGFAMATKRRAGVKRRSRSSFIIAAATWGIAFGVLLLKRGSLFNPVLTNTTITQIAKDQQPPADPTLNGGVLPVISNIVQSSWFTIAFLGLLIVGGLIMVQSFRVALRETGDLRILELQQKQTEGLQAVHDAIKIVDDETLDPRSRIINCYRVMMSAAQRLGAPVSSDQTARELDRAIRTTFALKGSATTGLTQLFEEARYSLHEIHDDDALKAHEYLDSIAGELRIQLDSWT